LAAKEEVWDLSGLLGAAAAAPHAMCFPRRILKNIACCFKIRNRMSTSGQDPQQKGRPFLSVTFACCSVYTRIYRSADGTHYAGRCPKCGKAVKFTVGEGGTSHRAFIVR
jgi:hypothetical protein